MRRTLGTIALAGILAGCTITQTAATFHKEPAAVTPADQVAAWTLYAAYMDGRSNDPRLACIRSHESASVTPTPWHAYNPAGPYYGAYQYLQGTWDNVARSVGRPELAGIPPVEPYVGRWDQDDVTIRYLDATGDMSPWGGPCG